MDRCNDHGVDLRAVESSQPVRMRPERKQQQDSTSIKQQALSIAMTLALMTSVSGLEIQAGGSSFAARLYQQAILEYTLINKDVHMTYTSMSSSRGTCRLMGYSDSCDTENDKQQPTSLSWAGSDSLLTPSNYLRAPDLHIYPATAGAVAVVFNLPGWGSQAQQLRLTPAIVARIFRADISNWAHPEIAQLNPTLHAAGILPNASIRVVARAGSSGTTYIFKKSLSKFDDEFAAHIGTTNQPSWPGVDVIFRPKGFSLVSYVLDTPYTISYIVASAAKEWSLPLVTIQQPDGTAMAPTGGNVQVAMVELWLGLGSHALGSNHASDTTSTEAFGDAGARGLLAWPFTGFSYLVIRTNTTQYDAGEDCDTRRAVVKFWRWFYTSTAVSDIANDEVMSPLPTLAAELVLTQLEKDVTCDAEPAFKIVPKSTLNVVGPDEFSRLFRGLSMVHENLHSDLEIAFSAAKDVDLALISDPATVFDSKSAHLTHFDKERWNSFRARTQNRYISLPFAGVSIGVVHSLCEIAQGLECPSSTTSPALVLDIALLDAILNEQVRFWHDGRVLQLNPWLQQSNGSARLQNARIRLWGGPLDSAVMSALASILRAHGYSGEMHVFSSGTARSWRTPRQVSESVLQTPGSIGIVLLVEDPGVALAAILPRQTAEPDLVEGLQDKPHLPIVPSSESVMHCVSDMQQQTGLFFPELSLAAGCYPLTVAFSLVVQREHNASDCGGHSGSNGGGSGGSGGGSGALSTSQPFRLARWLEWMYCDGAFRLQDNALCGVEDSAPSNFAFSLIRASMAPLSLSTPRIVLDSLFDVTCDGVSLLKRDYGADPNPDALIYTTWAIASLLACVGVVFAACSVRFRRTRVFKSAQVPFLLVMVSGVVVSLSSLVPFSLSHHSIEPDDPSRIGQRGMYLGLDRACNAEAWLRHLGLTLTFCAIFAKLWRIKKLLVNPKLKKIKANVKSGLVYVFLAMSCEMFVLTIMTIVDPPFYFLALEFDSEGDVTNKSGRCTSGSFGNACLYLLSAMETLCLAVGMVIVVQARNVPTKYNEGKYIAVIIVNLAQVSLLKICIQLVARDQEYMMYVVGVIATLFTNAAVLFLLFIPKFVALHEEVDQSYLPSTRSESASSPVGRVFSGNASVLAGSAGHVQREHGVACDNLSLNETSELRADNAELRHELRLIKQELLNLQSVRLKEMGDKADMDQRLTFNAEARRSRWGRVVWSEAASSGRLSKSAPPARGGARPTTERASSFSAAPVSRHDVSSISRQNVSSVSRQNVSSISPQNLSSISRQDDSFLSRQDDSSISRRHVSLTSRQDVSSILRQDISANLQRDVSSSRQGVDEACVQGAPTPAESLRVSRSRADWMLSA